MRAKLARSLSGHDKDRVHVVVKEEKTCVWLADGKGRTLDSPKRKNRRHIQIIYRLPEEIRALLEEQPLDDVRIKRALRLYEKALSVENQED